MSDLLDWARPTLRRLPAGVQNALRLAGRPRQQRRLRRDLAEFRRDMEPIVAALRRRARPLDSEVLIHALHGFVPLLKEHVLQGAMLLAAGTRPVYLTARSDGLDRYLNILPFSRLVYWDDFATQPTDADTRDAERLIAEERTFKDLIRMEHGGIAVGRHALSWLMRSARVGSVVLDDHRKTLVPYVAQSLAAARAAAAVLDAESCSTILMSERGYTPYGELFDEALGRRRRVVQSVAAHRDDGRVFKAYTLATRTLHPNALSADSWTEALSAPFDDTDRRALLARWEALYASQAWFNRQRLQHHTSMLTRDQLVQSLGLSAGKPTAALFAHIFWDATFFYGDSLYDDYQQWFVETLRRANQSTTVNWVVKLHPVNVWRLDADGAAGTKYAEVAALEAAGLALAPHVKLLMPDTNVSTWSLFNVAEYAFTVRGTVGVEMAALGKRVVTAGTGHYSGRGFTVDPSSRAEYEAIVLDPTQLPPVDSTERERASRYAHYLLDRKPYRFDAFRFDYSGAKDVVHAFNGRPRILAPNGDAFLDSAAALNWARWMMSSTAEDCLDPSPQIQRVGG